jgi:hypothetical protein
MSDIVVLDACCLINLSAADALDTWLGDIGLNWMLPEAVVDEALFLRCASSGFSDHSKPESAESAREPILLEQHIQNGLLTVIRPETEEEVVAYVTFAHELDDGEAMALAIAQTRGWQLATDDRKAIRLAGEAGVPVLTTTG